MSVPISFYADNDNTTPMQILHSFFEDDKANTYFYYTSKSSIYGLNHPDHMIKNDDDHKFARIALLKFTDLGDNTFIVYMNETMDVTTIASSSDSTNYKDMKSFKVHVECKGAGGRVDKNSVRCTVTNSNSVSDEDNLPSVRITEDPYQDEEGNTKYGVGIWVDITGMRYLVTNVDKSLSANSVPIDVEHYPTAYSVEYLNNFNKMADENLLNIEDLLLDRTIITSTDSNTNNSERLKQLEEKTKHEPHQFEQNTVVYDPTYTPSTAKVEDTIKGTSIIGPTLDRIITVDPVKKTCRVTKEGIYMLQLKNGFYLVQGESRVDLNVYIGTNQIKEMRICSYLTSNPEGQDDGGKVIKNIYSSNIYICKLDPETDIKLTANFMNTDNIVLENETMLTITALQYNIPTSA